jgi:hypothetical protein
MPPPPPGTAETRDGATTSESYRPRTPDLSPRPGVMPPANDMRFRAPARPPVTRFDRIASQGGHNLQGKVVRPDRTPGAGARVLLVSVDAKSNQQTLTADRDGAFRASVAAGGWLVYTHDEGGRPVFSRRIEVPGDRPLSMTLTQR